MDTGDSGIIVDTGSTGDSGIIVDTGGPGDSGIIVDTGGPGDSGIIVDTGGPGDSGIIVDTGGPGDSGIIVDTGGPGDSGIIVDTGACTCCTDTADTACVRDTADTGCRCDTGDTGSVGTDTGSVGTDTGSVGTDTGKGDTATHTGDTATHTGDTATHTGDTATHTGDTATHTGDTATHTGDTATHTGDTATHTGDTGGTGAGGPIRFVAVGDAGMGNATQFSVGAAMATICAQEGCDFALYLGDNIYPSGVTSVTDAQFQSKFENPYAPLSVPFFVVAGNHDYGGWWDPQRVEYQVDYTAYSTKWYMPDTFYTQVWGDLTLFALDTQSIYLGYGQDQELWMPGALAAANTTWKIAFGHHPYLSNGNHGNAGEYDGSPGEGETVRDFIDAYVCGEMDVYLCGHDHVLEWLHPTCGTEFLLSGAGASTYSIVGTNPTYFDDATPGFLWVEIDGNTFTGVFYDQNANELYRGSFTK